MRAASSIGQCRADEKMTGATHDAGAIASPVMVTSRAAPGRPRENSGRREVFGLGDTARGETGGRRAGSVRYHRPMATSQKVFVSIVVASTLAVSCGSDNPPPYGMYAGAFCRSDLDCGGFYCVDPGGGTCQAPCRGDLDCGPGFRCRDEGRRGANGRVNVCIPN